MGSNNDFRFELAILKDVSSSCEVHVFDHTATSPDVPLGVNFHPWGLASVSDTSNSMYTLHEIVEHLDQVGKNINIFKIDWLHAVDQGAGADFLGNVFLLLLGKMEGSNKNARLRRLLLELNTWYRDNEVGARLNTRTRGMIRISRASPKLRCKAAECRALIPFADYAARK